MLSRNLIQKRSLLLQALVDVSKVSTAKYHEKVKYIKSNLNLFLKF